MYRCDQCRSFPAAGEPPAPTAGSARVQSNEGITWDQGDFGVSRDSHMSDEELPADWERLDDPRDGRGESPQPPSLVSPRYFAVHTRSTVDQRVEPGQWLPGYVPAGACTSGRHGRLPNPHRRRRLRQPRRHRVRGEPERLRNSLQSALRRASLILGRPTCAPRRRPGKQTVTTRQLLVGRLRELHFLNACGILRNSPPKGGPFS